MLNVLRYVFIGFTLFIFSLLYYKYYIDETTIHLFKRIVLTYLSLLFLYLFVPKVCKLFLLPFIIVFCFQFISFFSVGSYVTPLVFENIAYFNDIGNNELIKIIALSVIIIGSFLVFINSQIINRYRIVFLIIFSLLFCITFFLKTYPFYNFYSTFCYFYNTNFSERGSYDGSIFVKNFVSSINYNKLYEHHERENHSSKKNIIVLFVEGMSDRVISSKHTPNLYELKKKSLVFNNYYNHTAATFRGIRGQLISGYQKLGGYYKNQNGIGTMNGKQLKSLYNNQTLESLPSILNSIGYKTFFVGPHECDDNLYSLMKLIGFMEIKGKCDYSKKNNDVYFPYLTDKESFSLLKEVVSEHSSSKNPFFISFYNIQTHHGMIVNDHIYDNGNNEYYNKFYNFDFYLDDFLRWLESKNYLDDTVVVITSDHSTYSVDLFEKSYNYKSLSKSRFVDKIPLFVYSNNIKPLSIDVNGRNSLGLAPTVLDLLGIDNVKTHFLGNSLFSEKKSYWENLSIVNDVYVYTGNNEPHDLSEIDKDNQSKLDLFYRFAM